MKKYIQNGYPWGQGTSYNTTGFPASLSFRPNSFAKPSLARAHELRKSLNVRRKIWLIKK